MRTAIFNQQEINLQVHYNMGEGATAMREIKFRWWVTNGEDFEDKFFDAEGNVIPHMETDLAVPEYMPINDQINAKGATPMQYTGLKDKNSKEIYEGDIIKSPDGELFEIDWQPFSASWRLKNKDYHFLFAMRVIDLFEVVGNIYENPELLEAS